jgi:rubrerythrin
MTDDNIQALENKAVELLQGQKWAEALAVLEELARAKPLPAGMLHNKAVCHAMLKQFHQARWDLRQVLRQKPGYERSVVLLNQVQREIGRMPPGLSQREEARVRAAAAAAAKERPQHAQGPKAADKPQAEEPPEGADDAAAAKAVVRFRCPQCGARLEETSALSGQQVPCPACGAPCDVPHRRPRGKVVLLVTSWSLAALVLIGVAAAILLNPDLLAPGKPAAPVGPASRPGPAKPAGDVPLAHSDGGHKPPPLPKPATRPATRPIHVTPATGPTTKPTTRPTTKPATKPTATTRPTSHPASRPATRPVATTRPATHPASKPVAITPPTSRPASKPAPPTRPATAPASAPALNAE